MTTRTEIGFGNIILANSGKRGILKPDENGNYRINAGGFNIPNHAGITYPANRYIQSQMEDNSDLQRRVLMGQCYMEEEHPEPYNYVYRNGICYKEEMTDILQWINRLRSYDKDNICGVISKIFFIFDAPGDVTKPIYNEILAKPLVKYKGGVRFKENLDTPEANTAVSIRTQVEPFRRGDTKKEVVYWTGYDWVKEPGMVHANKHMSAGCESILSGLYHDGEVINFKTKDVIEALEEGIRLSSTDEVAFQRFGGFEAKDHFEKELEAIKRNYQMGDRVSIKSGMKMSSIFD